MPIDDILLFRETKAWFAKHDLLPSTWSLTHQEAERIIAAQIGITICSPPANCVPLHKIPEEQSIRYLITVDPSLVEDKVFSARQQIGVLLHEIGHVVNPRTETSIDHDFTMGLIRLNEHEIFADDYVRFCGYGEDFAESMEVMISRDSIRFDTSSSKKRVELLREDRQLHLNLQSFS